MLQVGERIPDATVQSAPGEEVRLRALAEEGAVLLLFYLFDWSST
jgi:peroxiredoxin